MKRTLDWVSQHDERSREFPIRDLVGNNVEETSKTWETGAVLDQGREGACVGMAFTGELLAEPVPFETTALLGSGYAKGVYNAAKRWWDEWPGESYSGTSVLAGAKVIRNRGFMDEYRWCFGIEDLKDTIISYGPVVIGVNWYSNMYQTRENGLVDATGRLVGGHAILVTGYESETALFRWRNSWGTSYGINGDGFIAYEDLDRLLKEDGEACVPVGRNTEPRFEWAAIPRS